MIHDPNKKRPDKKLQEILYYHKYILYVFYYGLVFALVAYTIKFLFFLYGFITTFWLNDENVAMVGLLTCVDMAMVANLIKMVITGSYQSFVEKVPENTEKVSSGLLKVKMATSLVGVTAIHLLKVFVEEGVASEGHEKVHVPDHTLYIFIAVHIVFVISSIALAWIDYLHSKSELTEANAHQIEHRYEIKVERHHKNCDNEGHHI